MPNLSKLVKQINELGPDEREELFFQLIPPRFELFPPWWMIHKGHRPTRFPGIVRTPGVCGGSPRFIRTRIPVWVLEQSRRLGMSEIDLLRNYPTLRAQDLVNAWSYVLAHRDEIDLQIRENEAA